MGIIVKALQEIISSDIYPIIADKINNFSCKNSDVETFLRTKAVEYENRNKSRTYLLIDDKNVDIMAYYTLSLKAIDFRDTVSKTTIQTIDGFSKKVESVATILIGQLGKDTYFGNSIEGAKIIEFALNSIYNVQDIIGGRVCFLETEDTPENQKVIDFYADNGFKVLQHDKTDKYLQMFRKL